MAKCPKCEAEIDRLNAVIIDKSLCSYDGISFDHVDLIDFDIECWKCPECYQVIEGIELSEEGGSQFLTKGV